MPFRALFLSTALLALAQPALAAPPSAPSPVLTGADLFSLEVATDPQISPDGTQIAYVRRSNDVMTDRARGTIWLIDTRTGAQTPLVAGPGGHGQPRWSPDGKRLAYVSSTEGSAQLFVRWMATGATARITGLPDTPGSMVWSPDSRRIAYTLFVPDEGERIGKAPPKPEGAKWADPLEVITAIVYRADGEGYIKPGYDQVYTVSAEGGAPVQLTFGARNAEGPLSWSADGSEIYFSGNLTADWEREGANTEVHAVSVATRAVRTLTTRKGPDANPVVSPDGRQIAFVGYEDRFVGYQNAELSVMDVRGGGVRSLTRGLDRSVGDPVWSADGRAVYVSYEDHGTVKVARVGLDGSVRTVAEGLTGGGLDRPYAGGAFSVARDGSVAITKGSATRPSDIALVRGGAERQLTRLNQDWMAAKTVGAVEKMTVAAFDNRPIEAWITKPPSFDPSRKYPLILEIHGGPFAAYGPNFSTDDQLYAAAGYVVLSVNPRGSTSYGEDFANQIDKAYPGRDYDDLMSAVDGAIAKGFVDSDNLFVTGGSGGGVLTAWIVGKTDRFKAAVTQKPVIDWASFALTADGAPFFARYWFGKMPWEDPQGYWARSPLSFVGNVKTPTMVVVGSEDYRTPVSEAEQYYAALQLRGIPTALVKVPGASHGGIAARPSQSAAKASAILAWFERYRKK